VELHAGGRSEADVIAVESGPEDNRRLPALERRMAVRKKVAGSSLQRFLAGTTTCGRSPLGFEAQRSGGRVASDGGLRWRSAKRRHGGSREQERARRKRNGMGLHNAGFTQIRAA
jgi:hypothetical protein